MVSMPGAESLRRRAQQVRARRPVRGVLVSLAGLLGRPVFNQAGAGIGQLVDVVCRWAGEPYPPVTGLVVKIGRRRAYVPAEVVDRIEPTAVRLRSARLDLRDFQVRGGEVRLAHDVLDHQMVDTDGVRVIRASDLYLSEMDAMWRLVGAEVGLRVLARRIGPARWRARPAPDKVIDWSAIQALGGSDQEGAAARQVRLRTPNAALTALRPAELADLLAELGREPRNELLEMVQPGAAADALEEMESSELESLLREAPTGQAAALLAQMEPDEAVDALRELPEGERDRLLAAVPAEQADRLRGLLGYDESSAGGVMTPVLVTATQTDTVGVVVHRLRAQADHAGELDAICVVDPEGRLIDDVTTLELLLADSGTPIGQLVGAPWPVTVAPDTPLREVVEQFIDARRQSVVVVDDEHRPVGRILADDLVDALVPDRGRFRIFPLVP
ncbi:MgtE intracellular region [Pseudonocardia dioxanivorans CB1190]|uniref:MgtE intracellular region n=2 Tax=Pseudonocardia dioxanivorans TaxID=240495 RepID=F4CLX4_PSEUX|nr:MgtE intracellular region [Pseudonocardia dioxanivorans CB1190]